MLYRFKFPTLFSLRDSFYISAFTHVIFFSVIYGIEMVPWPFSCCLTSVSIVFIPLLFLMSNSFIVSFTFLSLLVVLVLKYEPFLFFFLLCANKSVCFFVSLPYVFDFSLYFRLSHDKINSYLLYLYKELGFVFPCPGPVLVLRNVPT